MYYTVNPSSPRYQRYFFFSAVAFHPVRLGKIYCLHYRGCLTVQVKEEVAALCFSKNARSVCTPPCVCVCYLFISLNFSFIPFNTGLFAFVSPVSSPAH